MLSLKRNVLSMRGQPGVFGMCRGDVDKGETKISWLPPCYKDREDLRGRTTEGGGKGIERERMSDGHE